MADEELSVTLSLKDAFSNQMKDAVSSLDTFKAGLDSVAKYAKITAGVISASFALMARDIMQTSEQLVKMNKMTGFSIEKLQELSLVAELNGSSLQSVQVGLRKLSQEAVQASQGSEEAAASFKRLGINVVDAQGEVKNMEQLFNETVEALSKVQNGTEQSSLALKLFGRAGNELLPVIKEGAAGFEHIGKIARDMGIIINGETVEALETWGDKLTVLKEAGKGLVAEFLLKMLDYIPTLINLFFEFVKVVNIVKDVVTFGFKAIANEAEFLVSILTNAFAVITNLWSSEKKEVKSLGQLWEERTQKQAENTRLLGKSMEDTGKDIEGFKLRILGSIAALDKKTESAKTLTKALSKDGGLAGAEDNLNKSLDQVLRIYRANGDELQKLEGTVRAIESAISNETNAYTKNGEATAEQIERLKTLSMQLGHAKYSRDAHRGAIDAEAKATQEAIEKQKKAQEELNKNFEQASKVNEERGLGLTIEQLDEISRQAVNSKKNVTELLDAIDRQQNADPFIGMVKSLRELAKQLPDFKAAYTNLFRSIESSFSDAIASMIDGTQKASDAFKDMFDNIKKAYIKMIADMISQQMMRQVAGGLQAALSYLSGGNGRTASQGNAAGGGGSASGAGASATNAAMSSISSGSNQGVGGASWDGAAVASGVAGAGLGIGGAYLVSASQGGHNGTGVNVTQSTVGYAMMGAQMGMVAGPWGALVGAVVGAAYGYYVGSRDKAKAKKAKREAWEAEQARLAEIERQRQAAAALFKKEISLKYGGGLLDPAGVDEISEVFSGDVTPGDLDRIGADPQQINARRGEINQLASANGGGVTVESPIINVNVGNLASSYDVQVLAQDLGYHMVNGINDAASGGG